MYIVLLALAAAAGAEFIAFPEGLAALAAEGGLFGKYGRSRGSGSFGKYWLCRGKVYHGRRLAVDRIIFIVALRLFAGGAIYEAIRIPRTETQLVIIIFHDGLAHFAGLAIGQTAMPFGSFVTHRSHILPE